MQTDTSLQIKKGRAKKSRVKKGSFIKDFVKQFDLQLLVLPGIIHIIIFSYIPMYGVLMAFQEFQLGDIPGLSQWVGFKQFTLLFTDPNFAIVMRNTVVISMLKLLINFPVPIIFALLLNELTSTRFKRNIQTISYLPHFISWVVGATLMFDFFSVDNGAVNLFLQSLHLIKEPIFFFGHGEYFWSMLVGTDLWKELGWSTIIYVASITSIDAEIYEAAEVDGAGRLAKMWYITISSIMPTIVLLLLFTIGNLLNANFDQIMMLTNQMGNATLREYADVIDTYVYRVGLREARYSFATAAGLFKSAINITLLLVANQLARKTENAIF